jgi:hypothetical protein
LGTQVTLRNKYRWVVIYDSFPVGAETWLRLRDLTPKEGSSIRRIRQFFTID